VTAGLTTAQRNFPRAPRHTSSGTFITYRHASYFKAARVTEFGKDLVIEEVKQKSLKDDEVRIGIYCCGINSIDVSNCSGELEPVPKLPFTPGYEV